MITTGDIQMSHGHAHISCPTVGHTWLECYLGTNAALHNSLMVQALITLRRGLGASFCYDLCFNCTSHAVDKHILEKPVDEHMRRVDKNTRVCLNIRYPQIKQFIIMSLLFDIVCICLGARNCGFVIFRHQWAIGRPSYSRLDGDGQHGQRVPRGQRQVPALWWRNGEAVSKK